LSVCLSLHLSISPIPFLQACLFQFFYQSLLFSLVNSKLFQILLFLLLYIFLFYIKILSFLLLYLAILLQLFIFPHYVSLSLSLSFFLSLSLSLPCTHLTKMERVCVGVR
jgi:hypothetical protein